MAAIQVLSRTVRFFLSTLRRARLCQDEVDEGCMIQRVLKVETDPKLATPRRLLLTYHSEAKVAPNGACLAPRADVQ